MLRSGSPSLSAALILRGLEKRVGTRGALALAAPVSLAIAIMCALTAVWGIDGTAAANPEKSQLSLLADYDTVRRPRGVIMQTGTLANADAALSKINIATPERRGHRPLDLAAPASESCPLGVRDSTCPQGAVFWQRKLVIGRLARPIKAWNLASDFRDGAATLELAATVGSLVIAGDVSAPWSVDTSSNKDLGR